MKPARGTTPIWRDLPHKAGASRSFRGDNACNPRLRSWAQDVGVYLSLEDYYEAITFIEGGRTAVPISLTRRPQAQATT